MATINDIAKKTGYAKSTISRYLNSSGYVSATAQRIIQQAIDELDYHPNSIARSLSNGATNKIGVVVPHVEHAYFLETIRGLMDAAVSAKAEMVLLPSAYDPKLEKRYLNQLRDKDFDSLIFTSRQTPLAEIAGYRKYGNIICMEDASAYGLSSVYVRRENGFRELFKWLKRKQIRHLALIFSRNTQASPTYRQAMASMLKVMPTIDYKTFGGVNSYQDAYKAVDELVSGNFDCILADSDDVAAYYLMKLPLLLERVPLVVSHESQLSGKLLHIPSVNENLYELGQRLFAAAVSNHQVNIETPSKFLPRD